MCLNFLEPAEEILDWMPHFGSEFRTAGKAAAGGGAWSGGEQKPPVPAKGLNTISCKSGRHAGHESKYLDTFRRPPNPYSRPNSPQLPSRENVDVRWVLKGKLPSNRPQHTAGYKANLANKNHKPPPRCVRHGHIKVRNQDVKLLKLTPITMR